MNNANPIPSLSPFPKLTGKEVYFQCKENERGSLMYRKLISNKNHTICDSINDREFKALKPTGSWMHEDDFAVKWVNEDSKCKLDIAIVKVEGGVIYSVLDFFDRNQRRWN